MDEIINELDYIIQEIKRNGRDYMKNEEKASYFDYNKYYGGVRYEPDSYLKWLIYTRIPKPELFDIKDDKFIYKMNILMNEYKKSCENINNIKNMLGDKGMWFASRQKACPYYDVFKYYKII